MRHVEACGEKCADACRVRQFEAWLDQPVLPFEIEAERRRQQRLKALMRGEVPA